MRNAKRSLITSCQLPTCDIRRGSKKRTPNTTLGRSRPKRGPNPPDNHQMRIQRPLRTIRKRIGLEDRPRFAEIGERRRRYPHRNPLHAEIRRSLRGAVVARAIDRRIALGTRPSLPSLPPPMAAVSSLPRWEQTASDRVVEAIGSSQRGAGGGVKWRWDAIPGYRRRMGEGIIHIQDIRTMLPISFVYS